MFKLIKWATLLALWSRFKGTILSVLFIWIFLLIFSNIISDIIEYTDKSPQDLIFIKWGVIVFFGLLSILLIFSTVSKARWPWGQRKKRIDYELPKNNRLKERVLLSENQSTKSEKILEDYRKKPNEPNFKTVSKAEKYKSFSNRRLKTKSDRIIEKYIEE